MPATLEMFTMSPLPDASSALRAARLHWKGPFTFTRISRSQSSSVTRSSSLWGMNTVVAALFTRMSSRPNSRNAASTMPRQAESSATSP